MALSQFKLANLCSNSVSFLILHYNFISGPTRRKKIKTYYKDISILEDIKILSRAISNGKKREQINPERSDCENVVSFALPVLL